MIRTHHAAPTCCSPRVARSAAGLRQRLNARSGHVRGAHEDGGFTLVEAVVSLTIFVIVAAAATLAIVTGITSNNATKDRIGAAQVAQQQIDEARAMPRAALTSLAAQGSATATPVPASSAARGNKTYSVQRVISYYPDRTVACPSGVPTGGASAAAREIRVNVVVTVPGSRRTVSMDTVLAC